MKVAALRDPTDSLSLPAEFSQQGRDALGHLYDLAYLQTHPLLRFVPPTLEQGVRRRGGALQDVLLGTLEALRPSPTAPDHDGRPFQIMSLRYVDARDVADIQAGMGISRSEYHRSHRRALAAVVAQ